jgi:hypothetical protein
MPIANAWICRGCWKPNKPGAAHCFACRLPRNADPAQIRQQAAQAAARAAVPDPVPDLLVTLPATFFRWEAKILIVLGGILFVLLFLAALTDEPMPRMIPNAFVMVSCVVCGLLFRVLAEAMDDRKAWGFFGAALVASAITGWAAYQLFVLPVPFGSVPPQVAMIRSWVTLLLAGGSALSAFMGLVLIAIRGQAPR